MEVRAITRHARISPLKARDVAREIQGLPASKALDILDYTPKKAAFLVGKTLRAGIANAENNHDLAADTLVVKEAQINEGMAYSRFKPAARGSAHPIKKRTSHIRIILTDEVPIPEPKRRGASKKKAVVKKSIKSVVVAPGASSAAAEPGDPSQTVSADAMGGIDAPVVVDAPISSDAPAAADGPTAGKTAVVRLLPATDESPGAEAPAQEMSADGDAANRPAAD